MRIKETKTIEQESTKVICDDCGVDINRTMACNVARCEICGKDLCDKCVGEGLDTMGDYREVYCKSCLEKGGIYRKKIKELEEEIDNLRIEWEKSCKK